MLITGACGFVGSIFANHFKDAVLLDNLSRKGSHKNAEKFLRNGRKIIFCDVEDFDEEVEHKEIIHCAANPSVMAGYNEVSPENLYQSNLVGTIKICQKAHEWGATLIYISSSRVYPIDAISPIKETCLMHGRRSHYGASKYASELIINEFDFPSHIFRCGLMAGAGQFGKFDQGIVSYWINSWRTEKEMKVFGFDGNQKRDVFHPSDLIELVEKALKKKTKTTCNISGGSENSFTLNELSDFCRQRLGNRKVVYLEKRAMDMKEIILDSSLASGLWGWRPKITKTEIFEEILKC
jgi:CDP-paratose 2-epimerase